MERKRATIADRGGICWHCIKCNAEVFEAQRVQVFCQCFLCSPTQITKAPLRQALLFFPQNKHTKLPVLDCNCPRPRAPHVAALSCTCLRHKLLCSASKSIFYSCVHTLSILNLYIESHGITRNHFRQPDVRHAKQMHRDASDFCTHWFLTQVQKMQL